MTHFSRKTSASQGFTLLEMIVSTSIFIIVMLVMVGALVSLNDASRKARSTRIVLDNLSAALDSMSRTIRMGSHFHCGCEDGPTQYSGATKECKMTGPSTGVGGDVCLAFEGPNGNPQTANDQIVYRLSGNRIERSTDGGASFIALTAPEIRVTKLQFFVYGTTEDEYQPVVTMLLRGTAAVTPRTQSNFNIQTTIAPRTPNFSQL